MTEPDYVVHAPHRARCNAVIYTYPFALDIVLFLALFVGRHSLAARGLPESTVGSVLLCYGVGYVLANLVVRHVVRPARARLQMVLALLVVLACCLTLTRLHAVLAIQAVFCVLPFAVSLFINAFQAFMLGVATDTGRPLTAMAGHYTFSWSMGFALGPLISGVSRIALDWPQIYLLAAGLTAALALLVTLFEPLRSGGPVAAGPGATTAAALGAVAGAGPPRGTPVAPAPATPPRAWTAPSAAARAGAAQGTPVAPAPTPPPAWTAPGPDLMGPAWLGLALGWIAWNAVSTWWAVQAAQAGFAPAVKGGVEFAFALTQGLGALLLILMGAGAWHHRPLSMALLGGFGVAGLLLFGAAAAPAAFVAAAVLLGVHTGSAFSLMLYHSLRDPALAVRRVALNETVVGLCFLTAPLLATALHRQGAPFASGYAVLAALMAAGLVAQTAWAWRRVAAATRV